MGLYLVFLYFIQIWTQRIFSNIWLTLVFHFIDSGKINEQRFSYRQMDGWMDEVRIRFQKVPFLIFISRMQFYDMSEIHYNGCLY